MKDKPEGLKIFKEDDNREKFLNSFADHIRRLKTTEFYISQVMFNVT